MYANATIAQLYYLLIQCDDRVDPKEIEMGNKMIALERLNDELFQEELKRLDDLDKDEIYNECVKALRKLEGYLQTRYLAWMCLIANSDGFMDKREWELIYSIYHKELAIPQADIMDEQRAIRQELFERMKGAA